MFLYNFDNKLKELKRQYNIAKREYNKAENKINRIRCKDNTSYNERAIAYSTYNACRDRFMYAIKYYNLYRQAVGLPYEVPSGMTSNDVLRIIQNPNI